MIYYVASGTPADGAGLGSASLHPPGASPSPAGQVSDRPSTPIPLLTHAPVDQGPGARRA